MRPGEKGKLIVLLSIHLTVQVVLFAVQLPLLLFGQRAAIGAYLVAFLLLNGRFLTLQMGRFASSEPSGSNAMVNAALLSGEPPIDFRTAGMAVGKVCERRRKNVAQSTLVLQPLVDCRVLTSIA